MNVLFDLDGTLTDPRRGILACFKYALEQLQSASPPDRILEGLIGPPLRECFVTLLGEDEVRLDRAVALYRERFAATGLYENVLYPGIRDALAGLRQAGCALFVATSKPFIFAQRVVDHFALGTFFRAVYGSELDGTNSIKEDLLAHLLQAESLSARETVMIGDRAHDILAARAHGLSSVGVLWGYGSRRELMAAGAQMLCEEPYRLIDALSCLHPLPSPPGRSRTREKRAQPADSTK